MAVIFVVKSINQAYYVSCKKTTYYSAKNSDDKFHNRCHLYPPPFIARYQLSEIIHEENKNEN